MTQGGSNPSDNGLNGGPDPALENMKQSPGTAPNTPRDSGGEPPMDFNMANFAPPGNSVSRQYL